MSDGMLLRQRLREWRLDPVVYRESVIALYHTERAEYGLPDGPEYWYEVPVEFCCGNGNPPRPWP